MEFSLDNSDKHNIIEQFYSAPSKVIEMSPEHREAASLVFPQSLTVLCRGGANGAWEEAEDLELKLW